jgi:hypothetical protein
MARGVEFGAERLAHLGSWVWDAGERTLTCSSEMYRMFGVDTGIGMITLDDYRRAVNAEDQDYVERTISKRISGRA